MHLFSYWPGSYVLVAKLAGHANCHVLWLVKLALCSPVLINHALIMPSCLPLTSTFTKKERLSRCSPMSFTKRYISISPSYISELWTFEMDSALSCPCYQWLLYVNRKSMTKVIWLYQMLFIYESDQCFSTYIVACSWDCKIIPSQGFDFRA